MEIEIENPVDVLDNSKMTNLDTKEKLEKNDLPLLQPSTSHEDETNWDNWTPATLRQPISEKILVTTNKQNKFTKEKSLKRKTMRLYDDTVKKKTEVYEKQLEMIEVEKERTMIRFDWEKVEHELRVEALKLEVEIK
ncbi:uncharacterized protein LOC126549789, partial [Aphis gossypii]|uniref:uncharacterized protein LOC126549789 n=1 Tax=Aphis gossypii TaxID=80765 RepID=UPI002159B306